MKRTILPLLSFVLLSAIALPTYALRDVASSDDVIRLWKAGWREADLVDFIRENEIWIDLSASEVADMAEAGIPRETIDKIVDEIDANEPHRAPVRRTYRPRRVYPTYGYYDPYHYPRYPRWSAHIDFGHFGFGHHGGHFGGGHHGGGHHGGHH